MKKRIGFLVCLLVLALSAFFNPSRLSLLYALLYSSYDEKPPASYLSFKALIFLSEMRSYARCLLTPSIFCSCPTLIISG